MKVRLSTITAVIFVAVTAIYIFTAKFENSVQ